MADVVFAAQPTLDGGREFYADIKQRAARRGRNPAEVIVMPGFQATIGRTEQEARDKFQMLQDLIPPAVGLQHLSQYIGFNLTGCDINGPLPDIPLTDVNFSRTELLVNLARRENLTVRQLYQRISGGRGHFQTYGTPARIADMMEEWFTTGAADGFNFMAPVFPGGLIDFVELVVPELQRRGLYRTAYQGTTLRDNLGLPRRQSQYLRRPVEAVS
jgi:alkanesulfonate monooxygenase